MEEKPEEVSAEHEDKEYTTYLLNGFKIKTGDEALETFKDKIEDKKDAETKMLAWVQGKMRLADPKKPAKEGAFDKASKRFLEHIFKEEMADARKQTKLTDTTSAVTTGTFKYAKEQSFGKKRGRPKKVK